MKDEPAIGVSNAVHSVLDVGAPFLADHAAGSPHRPLISTGVDGVAISDEFGPIPGVDGSTPESIARIARKYSLVDVVDGLLNKAPFEFQEVRSLSGCPVKRSEASVNEAVLICDPGRGLEVTLPSVDPYTGDPLSDDYGILHSPDHHLPCCSKASGAPVGPSSENEFALCCSWDQFHDLDAPQMVMMVNWAAVQLGFPTMMFGRLRLLLAVLVEKPAKPQKLAHDVDGVGSGTSSLASPSTDHIALCVKIRPEVEQPSCHTVGSDAISLESKVGIQIVPDQEVTCLAHGENSSSGFGMDSQTPLDDAISVTIPAAICTCAGSIGVQNEAFGTTHSSQATPGDLHSKDPVRAVPGNPMFDLVQFDVSPSFSLDGGQKSWAQDAPREVQFQPEMGDRLSSASNPSMMDPGNMPSPGDDVNLRQGTIRAPQTQIFDTECGCSWHIFGTAKLLLLICFFWAKWSYCPAVYLGCPADSLGIHLGPSGYVLGADRASHTGNVLGSSVPSSAKSAMSANPIAIPGACEWRSQFDQKSRLDQVSRCPKP
ncbi:hypothetical protein Nepgr_020408 [Nepenthes gracilis]|uniref:Uncharacterized protein n=1 Tax=Nepenthes gracilis TaxID=150966 RepID=A0AAD3XV18_NEPGR|nr:hypothetical protein Nepgr_020408 [Nepenthes gracilis]